MDEVDAATSTTSTASSGVLNSQLPNRSFLSFFPISNLHIHSNLISLVPLFISKPVPQLANQNYQNWIPI